MGNYIDKTKNYSEYKTLSALPEEQKIEYEKLMQPDPIRGIDVHTVVHISSSEAESGTEKEVDVTVTGVTKRILVKVPAGIESGKYIRYREKGELGQFGGKNGDLYVRVVVEPVSDKGNESEKVPVNGRDVNCTLFITNEEWDKGVEKEKEVTIDGVAKKILVKVPPAIQNGASIRYKGRGEAGTDGGQNGDLYVRIVVKEEETITNTQNSNEQKIPVKEPQTELTKEKTIPMNITFLEAAKGTEKEVILPEKAICKKCNGTGKIQEKSCQTCGGSGKTDAPKRIRVKVPAGVDEGQLLRMKVKGKKEFNFDFEDLFQHFFGSNEDWYAKVHIEKHPKFERRGYDIYSTEYLPFYIGSGRNVGVDTLDGKQYCTITKETKDGSQICLKNKGISHLNNPSVRGNHYITWKKK